FYDRRRGHAVMAILLLVMAAMMALAPLAVKLFLLVLIILILGTAEGTLDVGVNTLIQWVHKEKVAPYMNGLHFFYGVGASLSPLIVAQAMRAKNSIAAAYLILALLTLPASFLLLRVPSPHALAATQNGPTTQINYRLVVLIALFFFLYLGAEIGFSRWIFSYALKMNLSDETGASYFTAAFWGVYTIGRLVAIPLAIKLRPRTILLADL